jgi:hypothetical protein
MNAPITNAKAVKIANSAGRSACGVGNLRGLDLGRLDPGDRGVHTLFRVGNVPPDDTVTLVFNLSQGEDVRGPWNDGPEFEYVADPEPKGGMPPAPVNPSDERSAEARLKSKLHKAH